jgi:Methyltransferase domain
MSAIETWKQRVAAHQSQWHKARAALGEAATDVWEFCSPSFTADPRRTDDVEVVRLVRQVHPATTLLDVGGGAGRFALPLALHCQHVTVIEPSASMGEHLRRLAAQAGIDNVSLVARRWEEAEVAPADVVLCAHVIYQIEDIQAFVTKLVAHAREQVLMPTFMRPPMARFAPFWPWIYGEEQHQVPGVAEFLPVLWEMDIYPHLEMFAPTPVRAFKDWQRALETLRQRLCVAPDTPPDARLQQAMHELLLETPAGYVIKGTQPGRLALLSWQPE